MSKVLIIGAGGVSRVVVHKCAQRKDIFSAITLASRTRSKCDAIAAEIKRAVGTKWAGHNIGNVTFVRPRRSMSQIGG